jgi:type I restriction-modification system DNA methylase subunit
MFALRTCPSPQRRSKSRTITGPGTASAGESAALPVLKRDADQTPYFPSKFLPLRSRAPNLLNSTAKLSTKDLVTLQTKTFYGKEKKSLAYVSGVMNRILHGIEAPNIIPTNTLTENFADIQEKDRYHSVLANPPFGGKERPEVQQNFPIRTVLDCPGGTFQGAGVKTVVLFFEKGEPTWGGHS